MTIPIPDQATPPLPAARRRRWPIVIGALVLAAVLIVLFWDWNWLRPLVERQASAALGRSVTIGHFSVAPGRLTSFTADDVRIPNPDGLDAAEPFATAGRVVVSWDATAFLGDLSIVIPRIRIEHPTVIALENRAGVANWMFPAFVVPAGTPTASAPNPGLRIGAMEIVDGHAHVLIPQRRSDFTLVVAASAPADGKPSQLIADAAGSYAGQPITGHFVGGELLSLGDAVTPYPVDLHLANGPTKISLTGTVRDPLAFQGADLKLELAGPDMSLLLPLIGVAIPKTPTYKIAGTLDLADGKILFRKIAGQVGSSDIGGDLALDPAPRRPVLTGTLHSRSVDLADLGGFIGSEPGRMTTPNQTAEQHRAVAAAEASPRLLPTRPINLPAIRETDIHITYRGDKILGNSMPFDSLAAKVDIDDGRIRLTEVTLGVGAGHIVGSFDLTPEGEQFRTVVDIALQRLDVGRLLAATHLVQGSGVLGGKIAMTATGNSVASLLGTGDGTVQLFMAAGGTVSALLVDISGFQIGGALLSALGIPNRDKINCMVGDFTLRNGVLTTRTLLVDAESDVVTGSGDIDLAHETLNMRLKTDSKHFSIGTLPAPIAVTGPFKNPSIRPDIATLGARAGAAAGLGVLFPPAALLPTIQFGVGDDNGCVTLARRSGAAK